ncbi:lactoylglutathione lyase [Fertoebacter nigrum]|uniref:Lactoylglutathione lyase n=1 Tax=Fertoeibacter niger TaxID=2656921 RepID=A0A8X8GTU9_9RHOB|nr:VOC family protein [Fertoeibacter niger]NUB44238.1 lactoylglutathione lyase [Fertoeibacter niger]
MPQMIFVNIPVSDLERSKAFYQALGFSLNLQFADDSACCVVISDTIFLMILTHERFQGFATLPRADTSATTSVLICLSRDSREAVDDITKAALAAGGSEPKPAQDLGFMYSRTFMDPDGNVFEPAWMDMQAAETADKT